MLAYSSPFHPENCAVYHYASIADADTAEQQQDIAPVAQTVEASQKPQQLHQPKKGQKRRKG